MSATDRQNRLLVAEDWKKIYQSFRNADFKSYDFENLRRTMISYIRQNYPEDFNDYIESSEYLALIDLIAFLGQSIAFRVDLNARENFLELAERRESVLRLARMISYNSKRTTAAKGLLKFQSVQTTQTVIDSNGRNLAGQIINWNDPSNPNWYDQFIKIINAAVPNTQQFGNPIDKATIYGIPTEQYRFQSANADVPVYGFTKVIDGNSMSFEVTSTTFNNKTFIYEETPKVANSLAFIYRDDGRGLGSANSGFFLNFTQGTLNQGTFTITQPSSNDSIDIDSVNINNTDVWLYRLDKNNIESEEWTQVSNFEGNNIIYNSLNKNIRNIYTVTTRAGDRVALGFGDGVFGNLPLGTFRTYYRVSNGLTYTINPKDIRNVSLTIPYYSASNQIESLTLILSLTGSVSNALATESNDSIKTNAPQYYYTQNRMVTAEDYNISPLSASTEIAKIKALNRSSSGISRYFDLVDPTGKYSSTNIFATDGVVYTEDYTDQIRFSYANKTDIEGIIYNNIFDILKSENLRNFYYANYPIKLASSLNVYWAPATSEQGYSTGAIRDTLQFYKVGSYTVTDLRYLTVGALVKFLAPSIGGTQYYFDTNDSNNLTSINGPGTTSYIWAEVVSVYDDGTATNKGVLSSGFGPIALNKTIPLNSVISNILPRWRTVIDSNAITTMIDLIFANKPFGLRYNSSTQVWQVVFEANLNTVSNFSLGNQGDISNQQLDSSWLLLFTTDNEFYTVTTRLKRYIVESDSQLRFYYDASKKIYDSRSGKVVKDSINFLSINTVPDLTIPFTRDLEWDIVSDFVGLDGYIDNKKIIVSFADIDDNGSVDDPDLFTNIVNPPELTETNQIVLQKKYIIQQKYLISVGQEDYKYVTNSDEKVIILPSEASLISYSLYNDKQYFYFVDTKIVKQLNKTSGKLDVSLDYKVFIGRDSLKFQYIHSADYESRIDPGASNIIDVYVLTKSYDTNFRKWLNGANITKPLPPSSNELYDLVSTTLNPIKTMSDEIIYHPIRYKILFGSSSSPALQATFKVVKNRDQSLSDNDIKSRILVAMNQFFALENWDFGETFYFTELSTYVLGQLSPDIVNFVIVPKQAGLNFGSLFEIKSESDELFVNGATVDDIEIIAGITTSNIKSVSGTLIESTVESQQTITSATYGASNG